MNLPELDRVLSNLGFIKDLISLKDATRTIEISSDNNKLTARFTLQKGFYDNTSIAVSFSSEAEEEYKYDVGNYPITEFQSILSIVCPLLPKFSFLTTKTQYLTGNIIKDAIEDLRMCEKIMTVRPYLTNIECCPDWDKYIKLVSPKDRTLNGLTHFISIFPFRDAMYVTAYQMKETSDPLCELHVKASPFNFSPRSVVDINGQHYTVQHSIVAKQSQHFLAQSLRYIRQSIEELETLAALKPQSFFEDAPSNAPDDSEPEQPAK